MSIEARKAHLEATITTAIGVETEITVRGPKAFTLSTENVVPDLAERIAKYFGEAMIIESVDHDDECGSFVFASAA